MTKRFQFRWLALVAATAIALYLCWMMLEPFVQVLLWATVLVIVFFPVHKRIVRHLKRPGLAAAISCTLVVVTVLAPVAFVSVAVYKQAVAASGHIRHDANQLLNPNSATMKWVGKYVDIDRLLSQQTASSTANQPSAATQPAATTQPSESVTAGTDAASSASVREMLTSLLGGITPDIAKSTLGFVGFILGIALQVLFIIFTMFYLFRDSERILAAMYAGLPLEVSQSHRIFDRTREVVGASVYGVMVIAAIQALLGGLAFWVLGLPSPLLWTVVLFFFSMIPMAGSFLVWVPASLYLLSQGQWIMAVILAGWCACVVGTVDNILRPRLVGGRSRLHELLIFFSVLGGLKVFNVLGLVIGPVVVAITLALLDVLRKSDRSERVVIAKPILVAAQPIALEATPGVVVEVAASRTLPDATTPKAPPHS